jgi:hypothetical protein
MSRDLRSPSGRCRRKADITNRRWASRSLVIQPSPATAVLPARASVLWLLPSGYSARLRRTHIRLELALNFAPELGSDAAAQIQKSFQTPFGSSAKSGCRYSCAGHNLSGNPADIGRS